MTFQFPGPSSSRRVSLPPASTPPSASHSSLRRDGKSTKVATNQRKSDFIRSSSSVHSSFASLPAPVRAGALSASISHVRTLLFAP